MMAPLQTWWAERTARERRMLSVLGLFLGALFLWFAIVHPIQTGLATARVRQAQASESLATITSKVAALKKIAANPPAPLGSPIAAFIASSASEAGFQLSRADPVGADSVIVGLTSAKAPAFLAWMETLQKRSVFVERAAIQTNSDATIRVDATFKAAAR
jgi:general secretion pathway protein M